MAEQQRSQRQLIARIYIQARWSQNTWRRNGVLPPSAVWSQRKGARRTARGLGLHQLQPHKSTGVSSTSCLGVTPLHDVLETSQSREPTVPEPLGAPAVGREAGITWERGKGPRDRFGEGGMCYCEEGVCLPWRKEEGNAGLAPEGRCMAEFIGGKEAGTEASPEHWAAPSELTGSHGKRPRAAKQLRKACQDMAALGEGGAAPCQPPTAALGSHTMPCTAPHWVAAREVLVPRQGLKALNACAHQKTLRREQWVCSGCSQRGQGRAQKSWPQLMQRQEQSVPLLCSTMSCTNSESGSENFFSRGSEGTGVLPFSKAQGKKPGADEKALESSF